MQQNFTGYNKVNKEKAKILRKTMTEYERKIWYKFLRTYPIKWYRQRPIDHYIADFYCSKAGIIIEIDGSQHYTVEGKEYDTVRDEILSAYNLIVLRYSNYDIDKNFMSVCQEIDFIVRERLETDRSTPPQSR